jgi:hypothetical protein
MAKLKTQQTKQSVEKFLDKVADEGVRDDCHALSALMEKITGSAPKMWGPSIVGFGQYHYKYPSGHEGDSCLTGFSPRKPSISLYVMGGFPGREALLEKLGKHKGGKGCLYIKRLEDVDWKILESLIRKSVDLLRRQYPDKEA